MSDDLDLSVVVAASWSAEAVARTVASIGATDGMEVIVASDTDRVAPGPLAGGARWVVGERGDGVPRLRRLGADRARGRVVAFVEDACVVGPGWAEALRKAFRDRNCLVAQPLRLAGINFACRRELLSDSPTIREAELSSRLAGSIRWLDGASVSHFRHYRTGEALADRWRFGREFGRERWSDRPGLLHRLGLAAAPAILGVQLARLAGCLVRHPELWKPALIAGPRTLVLLTAWSAAEALGWAEASRGESRRRGKAGRTPASGPAPAPSEPAGCTPPPVVA
jgi:hypothetical protein